MHSRVGVHAREKGATALPVLSVSQRLLVLADSVPVV
jgi:hypothetical protein